MKTTGESRPLVSFDWAIKRLLRNKANFEVLEGFLSELLRCSIKIAQILESESNQETYRDKFNKVDILVEDGKKELMIIELQYTREFDYFHRMLYGTSRVIIDNLFKGSEYVKVKKVYSINIAYFDLGDGSDYVYHGKTHFKGIHTEDELHLSALQREKFGKMEVGDLHPEYYILKVNHFNDVAKDTLDEWIYYLKNNTIKDEFTAQGLDKAREILNYDLLSPDEKRSYDKDLDAMLGEASAIYTAKEEGKIEGIEEGREEERRKIALNCFRSGLTPEAISSITGLSQEEILIIIQQN
ncbi:hypothetical protein EZS27_030069 [termite gut metagenome]|uniref:Rpn family recombination-promoting nuclease/putative transposase n=1 Tax=termite gut metagenome TaxID=433724 RepID=A0A5J4QH09_9ZZZZ